jgi:phage gpG-like protein
MIAAKVKTKDETKKVLAKARQGNFKNLGHAGAAIRLTAKRSIRKRKKASPEGQPPSTRRGQLRGAIMFDVEKPKDLVVIGPEETKVGTSGAAHEHGGKYKRQRYPKRPFMGPALEKTQDRLPKLWAGSVKA